MSPLLAEHSGGPRESCRRQRCLCGEPECLDEFVTLRHSTNGSATNLRQRLIERHIGMARRVAGRVGSAHLPTEDLMQVAMVALIEAVDRFDPDRDIPFSAFALPTVAGSLKRHFRDSRLLRPPRRLHDLCLQLSVVEEQLTHDFRRAPTSADLARQLGREEAEIRAAEAAAEASWPLSLDAPATAPATGGTGTPLTERIGQQDDALELVESIQSLRAPFARLPTRQRRAIELRFFGDMTQSQIAAELGCSQVHVSRLLRAALEQLRCGLVPTA